MESRNSGAAGAPSSSNPALRRRDVLGIIAGAAGTAFLSTSAHGQQNATTPQSIIATALGDGQAFDHTKLVDVARVLARRPYTAATSDLPEPLKALNYEQYVAIKAQPQALIWGGEGRGFVVEPLHRGFVFTNPVSLFAVEDGVVRRIGYDRSQFEFGRVNPQSFPPDLDFSGFRLFSTSGQGQAFEFALVQGASFFRAMGRGQNYGVVSRTLTLRPAETRGEEFPSFRAFWFERPSPGSNALVAHGLLDSESVVGAVRMTFRPGEVTIVDVEMTLVPRVTLEHVGFAGMTGTFLHGPIDRRGVDDARAAVYEATGLQILNGSGELLWRPLQNPETLQISAFLDTNPQGFGLLQRERSFESFQDDDQRWERRPSLWIEPVGDWGPGAVQLIEIPSDSEVNDNILAYWRPKNPIAANTEASIAYREFWCWSPPGRPALASVSSTRVGRGTNNRRRRFLVDFSGESLFRIPAGDIKASLSATPGQILGLKLWSYPDRKAMRVSFDLDPGSDNSSEMRLVLEAGGKPISETWLYRWTP